MKNIFNTKTISLFLAFVIILSFTYIQPVCAADYSNITLTEEETELIASLVYHETKGEPLLSKMCFYAMILNRLKNENFPNDVRKVVYDCGAFDSAMKGKLSRLPSREEMKTELGALTTVIKNNVDPTCGALFTMKKDDPCLWEIMVLFTVEDRVFGIVT
ncbi:MAG: hypothetical protein E7660_04350 [Ruminococcaceae bacterium]|nr:hypothetical protein [Oscillospiraceae bacterium]